MVYAKVKASYKIEDYLNEIKYIKYRSAISKMRISAHTMPIEIGRWKGIPREERTCLICNSKETGDEAHYLAHSNNPTLQSLRQQIIEEGQKFASPTRTIFYINLLKVTLLSAPVSSELPFCKTTLLRKLLISPILFGRSKIGKKDIVLHSLGNRKICKSQWFH